MKITKMNVSEDEQGISKARRFNEVVEVTGSHFALQVALQTMKERCQRLQQRLSFLEEENSRLKLRKFEGECSSETEGANSCGSMKLELEQMKEQLSQLKRQKSQLSHQIIMVVTENKQLWNRLSHMTKVNQSLGGHLTKISDTLNQHASGSFGNSPKKVPKGLESRQSSSKSELSTLSHSNKNIETDSAAGKVISAKISPIKKGAADGSLEEISLKLLNSIQLEKTELEQQYAQMVEIHNDTSPSFNLNTMGLSFIYEDESQAVKIIKDHCKEMEKMKQSLLEQQVSLKNAVSKFTAIKDAGLNKKQCPQCLKKIGNKNEILKGDAAMDNHNEVSEEEEKKLEGRWDGDIEVEKHDDRLSAGQENIPNSPCTKEQMHICPMCGMKWSSSTPFEIFQKHVTDHFPLDDNDFTSLGNEFEAIP